MVTDSIVRNSDLSSLATDIRNDLARRDDSRATWVDATLKLCEHLAVARERFGSDNNAFGEWCEEQQFGLNHQDRAAAIAMGGDLPRAREVLEKTERRSLQLIHRIEFIEAGLTSVSKTPLRAPREPVMSDKIRTAFEYVAMERAAGRNINPKKADKVLGVSHATIEAAIVLERHVEEAQQFKQDLATNPPVLTEKEQTKLDRWKKVMEVRVREELRIEYIEKTHEIFNTLVIPQFKAKLDRADRLLQAQKGVISRADYRKLLACLHPDGEVNAERKAQLFHIIKDLEDVLVKPEEPARSHSSFPQTAAELWARGKEVEARKAAERAAKKAAKGATAVKH